MAQVCNIIAYTVIARSDLGETIAADGTFKSFPDYVMEALEHGWQPYGQLIYVSGLWVQPMVKYGD